MPSSAMSSVKASEINLKERESSIMYADNRVMIPLASLTSLSRVYEKRQHLNYSADSKCS